MCYPALFFNIILNARHVRELPDLAVEFLPLVQADFLMLFELIELILWFASKRF